RDTSGVRRRGWPAWTVDAVAVVTAGVVLVAVGDEWSSFSSTAVLLLTWLTVLAAAWVVAAGAMGEQPPRSFSAGIVAVVFTVPALAALDVSTGARNVVLAFVAALPLAIASFTAAVVRISA